MALFPNGKIFDVTAETMEELVEQNGGPPIKTKVAWITYAQMHLVTGFKVLAGPYEYRLTRLPIIRMSGRVVNIDGERIRYGVVRFMKDPARLKNFWRSIAAESLGYAPKAKWMVTESAVEGKEDTLRKAHTSRDPMMIFNDEAEFGKNVVRVDPPGVEAALLNESNVNAQDMRDVTGIHEASLGMKSNETSGKAIMARQREGDVANLTFHDNGNAAVLEAGDVLNQFMPQIYDGTRVMRTIGEDESIKFVRLNDPYNPDSIDLSVGMYDVALSTGTSYTTRRVEAAAAMMEAIQVWPNLMGIAGDLVAKAQDWPGADKLAERLKKTIPPQYLEEDEEGGGIGVTPEQLQEMQQQLQQLSTENQVLKMEQHNKERELDIKEYLAKAQMVRALSDHEVDQNKMEQDAIQMILDGSAKVDDLEIRQQQADNQRVLADATAKQKSTPTATSTSGSKTKSQ
jgi:regulator of replication initiation timing